MIGVVASCAEVWSGGGGDVRDARECDSDGDAVTVMKMSALNRFVSLSVAQTDE